MGLTTRTRGKSKSAARERRHLRLRKKIEGDAQRPRLVVTRSARHVFVQVVDDTKGITLVSASTMEAELRKSTDTKSDKSKQIGLLIADRATKAGITTVVFDRGGNRYAGRVAAIADGAREGGLVL